VIFVDRRANTRYPRSTHSATRPKPELSAIYVRVPKPLADQMRAVAAANDRLLSREVSRAFAAHVEREAAKPE
jgi:hypothetical protein